MAPNELTFECSRYAASCEVGLCARGRTYSRARHEYDNQNDGQEHDVVLLRERVANA